MHGLTVKQYRAKFNLENPNPMATKEKQLEALLTGAIVSEAVGNLCVFQCQVCLKTFDSRWKFTDGSGRGGHLNKENELCGGSAQYSSMFYWLNAVKRVVHKCRLCEKMLLCESSELSKHFIRKHGLTMTDYCRQTGTKLGGAAQESKDMMEQLRVSAASRIESSFGNFCQFACKQCDFNASSWAQMQKHFWKQKHAGKKNCASDFVVRAALHPCRVCSEKILCDSTVILAHLKSKHQMTKKQYVEEGTLQIEDVYIEQLKEFTKGMPVVQTPLRKRTNPPDALMRNQATKSVGNLCLFECPICEVAKHSWKSLQAHVGTHKGMKKWFAFDASYVREARYHRYLLCSTVILGDRAFIRDHLYHGHGREIDFDSYVSLVEKSGGSCFPGFREWKASDLSKTAINIPNRKDLNVNDSLTVTKSC